MSGIAPRIASSLVPRAIYAHLKIREVEGQRGSEAIIGFNIPHLSSLGGS